MGNQPFPKNSLSPILRQTGLYIACYAIWLAICASGLWLIFQVLQIVMNLALYFRFNPWQVRALDKWGIFVFGIAFFVTIFALEGYLRNSVPKGQLWRSATRSLFVLIVVTVLVVGINQLFKILL